MNATTVLKWRMPKSRSETAADAELELLQKESDEELEKGV
jgi:hypothetical protein